MRTFTRDAATRFSENLIRCRKRAGLSQEELGYRASVHRTQVSGLERGIRSPRVDTVVRLADSLSVSPSDLIAGIEWMPGYTVTVAGGYAFGEQPEQATDDELLPAGPDQIEARRHTP